MHAPMYRLDPHLGAMIRMCDAVHLIGAVIHQGHRNECHHIYPDSDPPTQEQNPHLPGAHPTRIDN